MEAPGWWGWDGEQLPDSWQRLVLGTLTLISSPWGILAVGQASWDPAHLPLCLLGDKKPCRTTAQRPEKKQIDQPRSEVFNPAVGDATSFSGASTRPAGNRAPGQHEWTAGTDATAPGQATVQSGQMQPRAKAGAAFLAPPDTTASPHRPLCPQRPQGGQGCASFRCCIPALLWSG